MGIKRDTLCEFKEAEITCEKSMGDTNEYWKLLEPSTKLEKAGEGRRTNVICGQCNKPGHVRSIAIGIQTT
jgi:hypothetical protein